MSSVSVKGCQSSSVNNIPSFYSVGRGQVQSLPQTPFFHLCNILLCISMAPLNSSIWLCFIKNFTTFVVCQTIWHHNKWLNTAATILIEMQHISCTSFGAGGCFFVWVVAWGIFWLAFLKWLAMVIKFDEWFTVSYTNADFLRKLPSHFNATTSIIIHSIVTISLIQKRFTVNSFAKSFL